MASHFSDERHLAMGIKGPLMTYKSFGLDEKIYTQTFSIPIQYCSING